MKLIRCKKAQLSDITSSRLDVVKDRPFVLMSRHELQGMEPAIEETLSQLRDHSSHPMFTQRKVDPALVEDEIKSLKHLINGLSARLELLDKQQSINHDLATILKSVNVLSEKMGNIVFCEDKLNLRDAERNLTEAKDLLISNKDHLVEVEEQWNHICQDDDADHRSDYDIIKSTFNQIRSKYKSKIFIFLLISIQSNYIVYKICLFLFETLQPVKDSLKHLFPFLSPHLSLNHTVASKKRKKLFGGKYNVDSDSSASRKYLEYVVFLIKLISFVIYFNYISFSWFSAEYYLILFTFVVFEEHFVKILLRRG